MSGPAFNEIAQHDSNMAAQAMLLPHAEHSLSWYGELCRAAAHSNGDMETCAELGDALGTMKSLVRTNSTLVRAAQVHEAMVHQRLGKVDLSDQSVAMLSVAVQEETAVLTELLKTTEQARKTGEKILQFLRKANDEYDSTTISKDSNTDENNLLQIIGGGF